MNEERMSVLKMVSEGKVTVEEAEKLLSAMDSPDAALPASRTKKFLKVSVKSSDGDDVNIRVPLRLIKAGVSLAKFAPRLQEKINAKGIKLDLNELSGKSMDEIVQALEELQVNVNSEDGDKVVIACE